MRIVKQRDNHYRIRDCVRELSNFWIDVDLEHREINIPATGDIKPAMAADLIGAIRYAADMAIGLITPELPPLDPLKREDWHDEVIVELQAGRKIGAIKACRRATGHSLAKAKQLVEQIQVAHQL